jgi:Family of unknown function (DUF6428)
MMNLTELKAQLRAHPELNVAIALPDGGLVPSHYHVTEVGQVVKNFVDCGGTFRASEACVLQTHVGSARDDGHRLKAGRLAQILDLARPILPSEELPVEVEYEDGVVSQFPLVEAIVGNGTLTLRLGLKHTDCLAKAKCGGEEGTGGDQEEREGNEACCAGTGGGRGCCS